jgi:hypothetical protein
MMRIVVAALGLMIVAGGAALAQSKQTAIVEDLTGKVDGVEVFDFVSAGQVLKLAGGAKIVLAYPDACVRDTIAGPGSVTVGPLGSAVVGAKLQTEQFKCASSMQLSSSQAGKSGAMVFRGQPGSGKTKSGMPEAAVTVSYTAPIFTVDRPGDLTIERLDIQETVQVFKVGGKLFDYGKTGKVLDAGGLYRVALNGRSTVFQVTMDAAQGSGPLLLRLVRF